MDFTSSSYIILYLFYIIPELTCHHHVHYTIHDSNEFPSWINNTGFILQAAHLNMIFWLITSLLIMFPHWINHTSQVKFTLHWYYKLASLTSCFEYGFYTMNFQSTANQHHIKTTEKKSCTYQLTLYSITNEILTYRLYTLSQSWKAGECPLHFDSKLEGIGS